MFRNGFTGGYSFYSVLMQRDDGAWDTIGPDTTLVPRELRRRRQEPSHHYESLEPWASLSASGEVWQKYGSYGWASIVLAQAAFEQLKAHNPNLKFAIAETTLSREVVFVVEEALCTGC